MKQTRLGITGDADTPASMADAVTYLIRLAADANFDEVVNDLQSARQKLELIATSRRPKSIPQ